MTDKDLTEALVGVALDAGALILDIYDSHIEVETKDDASPVTQADQQAEALILTALKSLAPGIPVIAEEEVAAGRVPEINGAFFLVDPLDGTKEFIKRRGEFTVNIALIRDGEPALGVVLAPEKGRVFAASGRGSAWQAVCNPRKGTLGKPQPMSVRTPAADGLVAVASKSHRTAETDAYLEKYPIKDLTGAGSSLKFCLVAAGEADLYPRLGRTMEWDTAAGHAVLRGAGGRVHTMDNVPLTYGKRNQADDSDFANPWFVAFGDVEAAS